MKRIIILIISLLTLSAIHISAQEKRVEIDLGYGMISSSEIIKGFADIFAEVLITGNVLEKQSVSTGVIHTGVRYLFDSGFTLGGVLAYVQSYSPVEFEAGSGSITNDFFTLAAEVSFRYIDNPKFKLYSSAGIAGTLYYQTIQKPSGSKVSDYKIFPDFHLSAIGARYGEKIGVFAETGFGYKGIISAGFFFRL